MITQAELHQLVSYDPDSGEMFWKSPMGKVKAGKKISCKDSRGYVVVRLNGTLYRVHRLAWVYINGDHDFQLIDHINGIKSDNRIENLRACSYLENARNLAKRKSNKTGFKGVSWNAEKAKFKAVTSINGKQKFLGYFDDAIEASNAYINFTKNNFGEFFRGDSHAVA